ncbi:Ig-like V-type domain-containing protein FAM187A, partial [Stegodyphus dumicola]|uniref:Ig-like V-type domain-containing protein FAM187A n=1 Tax=Stegodyphus dumicola TaxID=202533 RepID=UPI0015A832BB
MRDIRQEVQAILVARRSGMPYRSKDWAVGTIHLPPKAKAFGVWKRLLPESATFVSVHCDGRRTRITTELSLEINNALKKDSGIYLCFNGPEIMAKYAVDIIEWEPHRYIIMSGRKKNPSTEGSTDLVLNDQNLVVGMSWSEWSECNRCGTVGKRRRFGICTVKKLNPGLSSKPTDTELFNEYKSGLPCRSSLLPGEIRNLSAICNMKSEFVIGFCKIPCPSAASIVVVTDKNGKVLDTVDNSQGVYSMQQPLPPLPELVRRRTVYEELDKSIILTCPGNKEGKFLIWRNESYIINPSKVHIRTKGRVKIDLANNLIIRKLRYTDTATY